MSESVATIIRVAAAIAVAGAVVAFVWFAVSENTPDPTPNTDAQRAQIQNDVLCEAFGGTWNANNDPPCGE